jgi:hypothetical protein
LEYTITHGKCQIHDNLSLIYSSKTSFLLLEITTPGSIDMAQKLQPGRRPKPLTYRDFDLRLALYNRVDGTFKVWVEKAPAGSMKSADASTCLYDATAFWEKPEQGLRGPVGDLAARRIANKAALFGLGTMLSDLALPQGTVRALFLRSLQKVKDASEGLRLRLHIDDAPLAQLPWEYMFLQQTTGEPVAGDFLALRKEVSIVRTEAVETSISLSAKEAPRRIVGVLSSPDDQRPLNVNRDKEALEKAVQELQNLAGEQVVEIAWAERPSTLISVEQVLAGGADFFLFAGHGTMKATKNDPTDIEGQIILETKDYESYPYGSQALAQLLKDAGVRLTVLGACDTGRRDGQNVWNGIAPALIRQSVPCVIANQFTIRDSSATLIAARIYPFLLAGYTIDESLYEARKAIFQTRGLLERDWGTPVLYLQEESNVLFPLSEKTAENPSSPSFKVVVKIRNLEGEATGIKGENSNGGTYDVNMEVDTVKKKGKLTGIEFGKSG